MLNNFTKDIKIDPSKINSATLSLLVESVALSRQIYMQLTEIISKRDSIEFEVVLARQDKLLEESRISTLSKIVSQFGSEPTSQIS